MILKKMYGLCFPFFFGFQKMHIWYSLMSYAFSVVFNDYICYVILLMIMIYTLAITSLYLKMHDLWFDLYNAITWISYKCKDYVILPSLSLLYDLLNGKKYLATERNVSDMNYSIYIFWNIAKECKSNLERHFYAHFENYLMFHCQIFIKSVFSIKKMNK